MRFSWLGFATANLLSLFVASAGFAQQQPDALAQALLGSRMQRTVTLLATSTPQRRQPVTILVYPPKRSLLERLLEKPSALAAAPDWLERLLSRWPSSSFGQGAYLKLMPFTLEIR